MLCAANWLKPVDDVFMVLSPQVYFHDSFGRDVVDCCVDVHLLPSTAVPLKNLVDEVIDYLSWHDVSLFFVWPGILSNLN